MLPIYFLFNIYFNMYNGSKQTKKFLYLIITDKRLLISKHAKYYNYSVNLKKLKSVDVYKEDEKTNEPLYHLYLYGEDDYNYKVVTKLYSLADKTYSAIKKGKHMII